MTEYRKRGTRMFFKVYEGTVIRVLNKQKLSVITIAENAYMEEDALSENSFPCTESEFKVEFDLAMSRIQSFKV